MKKYLLLLLLPFNAFSQDPLLEKFVDSLVGPMNRPDQPGTMVMVAKDGKPVLQKAYGRANLELEVPLKTSHAFAIGSVSKQFTAVAVLQLAQQGKLKLSDDIRQYLPSLNSQGHRITIENLLSHTTGIDMTDSEYNSMHSENNAAVYPERFIDYAMSRKLVFEPGTEYSYSNFAYNILAILIEKITGVSFDNYMVNNVFKPADMSQTFIAQDLKPLQNVVSSYTRGYEGKWRNMARDNTWEWSRGAGSVITTLTDMLKWDIALREEKVLPKEWLEKAWTPYRLKNGEQVQYGFGWDVNMTGNIRIISHSGGTMGFAAQSVHVPEKNIYVFFVDFYASDPNNIPKKILARMLNIQGWSATAKAEADLSEYTGNYRLQHQGSRLMKRITDIPVYLTFTSSGDTLFVQVPLAEKIFLRPAGKDRFLPGRSENTLYSFNRDSKGKVISINVKPFLFGGPVADRPMMKEKVADKPPLKIVNVDSAVLKKYAGSYYRPESDEYLFITAQGNKLYGSLWNTSQRFELLPLANNKFVRKGVEMYTITFNNDGKGFPVIIVSGLRDREFRKVRD
jgi:CubicO group peptidase (beta-lactamase class C family)